MHNRLHNLPAGMIAPALAPASAKPGHGDLNDAQKRASWIHKRWSAQAPPAAAHAAPTVAVITPSATVTATAAAAAAAAAVATASIPATSAASHVDDKSSQSTHHEIARAAEPSHALGRREAAVAAPPLSVPLSVPMPIVASASAPAPMELRPTQLKQVLLRYSEHLIRCMFSRQGGESPASAAAAAASMTLKQMPGSAHERGARRAVPGPFAHRRVAAVPPVLTFISHLVNRTRISSTTVLMGLLLLHRLKLRFPDSKGNEESPYRLLLSAFIVAAKTLYDDTYDNAAWVSISYGLFTTDEVNRMERELLQHLSWNITVSKAEWDRWVLSTSQLLLIPHLAQTLLRCDAEEERERERDERAERNQKGSSKVRGKKQEAAAPAPASASERPASASHPAYAVAPAAIPAAHHAHLSSGLAGGAPAARLAPYHYPVSDAQDAPRRGA